MQNESITIEDAGRKIVVRPLSALEKMRIFKILPPGCDEKILYLSMAFTAASVRSIDDIPTPWPSRVEALEQVIGDLGDGGVEAIQKALAPSENDTPATETAAGN